MQTTQPVTPWMRIAEAAAYAQLSTKTVYRLVEDGKLRAARIGGRRALRFKAEWLDEALEAMATPVEIPR